jgi:hypothetical protein
MRPWGSVESQISQLYRILSAKGFLTANLHEVPLTACQMAVAHREVRAFGSRSERGSCTARQLLAESSFAETHFKTLREFHMPAPTEKHEDRVKRFCADLELLKPNDVIRKHITTGMPVYLDEEQYFDLRSRIADEFKLYPSEVVLVGSCRMGFSIAPKKRYREARRNSDLDVAIVSLDRFDNYWDGVFAYAANDAAWKRSKEYRHFVRTLFNGWIDPRGLPNVPRFEQAVRWTSFFDTLMQSRQFGSRRITARLYRTWMRLEAYQEKSIRQCRVHLGDHHA